MPKIISKQIRVKDSNGEWKDVAAINGGNSGGTTDSPNSAAVTSVNGKTGKVILNADDVGAVSEEQFDEIADLLTAETAARERAVADLSARLGQQTLLIAEGETLSDALAWLEANGDKTKAYLMPDGFFYTWKKTTEAGGAAYEDKLPHATAEVSGTAIYGEDYNGDGANDGYLKNTRLSSSGSTGDRDGAYASGFITAAPGDTLRIKGHKPLYGLSQYVISYDSSGNKVLHQEIVYAGNSADTVDWSTSSSVYTYADGIVTVPLTSANFGSGFSAIRFSCGYIDDDTVVTVNEEIKEGSGTVIVEKWAGTGHSLVESDYSTELARLITVTDAHTAEISELREAVESGNLGTDEDPLDLIRGWDAPIYDRAPVFLLDSEKTAIPTSERTVEAVYAKYDALMAENPRYITKTDLGLCSDGVTHVYRYDFCEPESRHQSGFEWSETKPKFIVVSGIHREWNGIYSMFHALAEISTNSELAELRRSVHFIVVPVMNPYSISGPYATVGHAANYNGVEIHRNFEVGFKVQNEGTFQYSGAAPLSEVESQYLDNILKNNSDAAYFLTCHSFDRDKTWGVGFLWGSSATKYMCNMAFRVIDKMGRAWHEKYGTTWEEGIARENAVVLSDSTKYPNAKALEEGDYRIGHAALTSTGGCEQRQATKYGIQATNFETGETFFVLDQTMLSAKAITHGTEAYINFFLTAMDCYDFKDKREYFKG